VDVEWFGGGVAIGFVAFLLSYSVTKVAFPCEKHDGLKRGSESVHYLSNLFLYLLQDSGEGDYLKLSCLFVIVLPSIATLVS
jgi:hypothetical protein